MAGAGAGPWIPRQGVDLLLPFLFTPQQALGTSLVLKGCRELWAVRETECQALS